MVYSVVRASAALLRLARGADEEREHVEALMSTNFATPPPVEPLLIPDSSARQHQESHKKKPEGFGSPGPGCLWCSVVGLNLVLLVVAVKG